MDKLRLLKSMLVGGASMIAVVHPAFAKAFDIPRGDLATALSIYMREAGVAIIYSNDAVRGHESRGAKGNYTETAALAQILKGTGFVTRIMPANAIGIVPVDLPDVAPVSRLAEASTLVHAAASVETVVVTSSKIKGDIQTVPIAITALSQEQLTSRQIAGGPDLVKEVPNLTFSKTNFTGYNIEIRGIGTQAISVTTDPAVAVAFNDTPFIRNHFFEQEFYDVSQVEVLRGPQGTLYGRNATAGVVNVVSAKPTDQFEAMLSADWGNYNNRRYEGMVNIPVVDDRLDIRAAGEWTKRDGYSFNEITNKPIDGRDLWSSRLSIRFRPSSKFDATLIWEHFQENDDRLRSSKQLCKTDPNDKYIGTVHITGTHTGALGGAGYYSQGCLPVSLYSPEAFEVTNGSSLPYVLALVNQGPRFASVDPYTSTTQSRNLRVIESTINPVYKAKNDVIELNADYIIIPSLTLTSQTGFDHDFLYSAEDYNRFNTTPDVILYEGGGDTVVTPDGNYRCYDGTLAIGSNVCSGGGHGTPTGVFCDPQLGCTSRLVAEDLSDEHAWQLSQELRFASDFTGPVNFSLGANYLHYETQEDYYVFINALTLFAAGLYADPGKPWTPGVSDNSGCLPVGFMYPNLTEPQGVYACRYIDPNPISSLNGNGHNYFRSSNPYVLNSYAGFGEIYYQPTSTIKLIGGLRWTDDKKHFADIPSEVLTSNWGYPTIGIVDQEWQQWTGRGTINWTPKLDFTDQTLVYGSFAHGYKAGGANPPGAVLLTYGGGRLNGEQTEPIHPLTFKPEFVNAIELGTKNTLLDGAITLNGDAFYYDYKSYQISEIVDRTSINLNFDAHVKGAELEAMWEPVPGLRLNFAGGYEDARLAKGSKAIDLMDRTAGNPNWFVERPFVTQASNCVAPVFVLEAGFSMSCGVYIAYGPDSHMDPVTNLPYVPNPTIRYLPDSNSYEPISGYSGFDISTAPNDGEGIDKNISGNQLPNAPHFTTSLSAEYTLPVSDDWAATLHGDFYWQSQSFARVFNDRPYDKLRGYSNVNLALILTSASGWQVLGYLKNVFDTTAITGDFLNSDDTGLTTNVFLTDPRLFGVRVTKNF